MKFKLSFKYFIVVGNQTQCILWHIYSIAGFGNPLSFKSITDEQIGAIEDFIRKNVFEYLTKEFCDVSVDNEYQVDIDDEILMDYFGPLYAHNTASFQFRPGDKMRIKEIVNYVKNKVDEGGSNKNLKFFVNKQRLKQQSKQKEELKTPAEFNEDESKRMLIEKVVPYFVQAGVDEEQFGEIVKIHISDKGKVYGDIFCAICKKENRKNKKAKRVCCNFAGKTKGVWVLSNFFKHLNTVHKINVHHNRKRNVTALNADVLPDDHISSDANESPDEEREEENDASLIVVDDKELKSKIQESKTCDTPTILYSQISTQITKVLEAVYSNNEAQSKMHFIVNGLPKNLTVAAVAKDGNCMFGSAVHQQFCYPLNSDRHKKATKKLRTDVVEHILDPKNFQFFLHSLKNRVYETKNRSEIIDIEMECKLFVRYSLSRNRFWGGLETLYAISDLFETNVIVFNEDDGCTKFKRAGKKYDRSIAVAYRIGGSNGKGEPMYNHYDSVCEIDSADLYAAAHSMS